MPIKKNYNTTRTNFNLPTHLREKVEQYAEYMGLNVTSALTVLIKNALDQVSLIDSFESITQENKKNIKN